MKVPVVAVLAWCGLLAAQGLAMGQQSGNQIHRKKDDGRHPPADALPTGACRGFVILPNGYAVLSGIRDEVDQAGETHTHHGSAPATAKAHMTHNQGGQDKSATRVEMTEIEKKEIVEFLFSLSSDYRSSWTSNPEDKSSSQRHQGKSQ